jgi:hypothetical protein
VPWIPPNKRPSIEIDDDIWDPRVKFAKDCGVSDRTAARRLRKKTRYIGGVAYVPRFASRRILGIDHHVLHK